MPDFKPGLDAMLCFDVYATNLAFGRIYKPLLDPLGVTYPQFLVLMVLWQRDNRTVGEIGTLLGLESSTLTPLLKRLQAAGLVTRTRDAEDERKVRVALTAEGTALRARAENVPACVARATGLDLDRIEELQGHLNRLRSALLTSAEAS